MTVADTVTVTSGRGQLWRGDMWPGIAKWDIPIGDEVECSCVARKVVNSSPARGTHA